MRVLPPALVLLLALPLGAAEPAGDAMPPAKSPEESLGCLRARPGFTVQLVAREPLVQDPVAFAWGPDGRLWVVEMGDYPLGSDNRGRHGGRVKVLEDQDGNGTYDRATIFLEGLGYPTGVLPWRKGALVTCAPDLFYAEDTDGDGKADRREVLYTGFVEGNQQHRVNGLVWGLDNWIYCANGDSGGRIQSVKTGEVVDIRGRDFRIRPDTGALEAQTGQTQFGRPRDDWGNWFGGNNSNPMWHYVLDDHYLRRNPHVAAPEPRVHVSVTPGVAPVFPASRTLPRFNDYHTANRFTSACSPIVYRDELFGPAFASNTFVSEPVHNLVHREVMTADGTSFKSRRAADEQQAEFLASSDSWFRPTMIQTGPDGALWVADMYRLVIEHPQWIPLEWQRKLDLRAGHDMGRLYRVYPRDRKPRQIPRLDRLDTAGLVAALDSPSGWQRDMAQQLLLWRQDRAAVPLLEELAAACPRPLGRLHALCTLDGLGALTPASVQRALDDAHPGVRRHAVRLCEGRLAQAPDLGAALLRRVDDADAQVRLQLACTLGEWDDPRAGRALAQLALRDSDRYLLAAVLSSVNARNFDGVLQQVLAGKPGTAPPAALVEGLVRTALATNNTKALTQLLHVLTPPPEGRAAAWQVATLGVLLDTLDQRGSSLAKLAAASDAAGQEALQRLGTLFTRARTVVADGKADQAERVALVRLLGRGPDRRQEDIALLTKLLAPQTPDELQTAAVAALGRLREPRVPEVLLAGWKGYTPALRAHVLDVLLGREEWVNALLDAVAARRVLVAEVDAARRQRLLEHRLAAVRTRAAKYFAGTLDPDRQKVIEAYRPALTLPGEASRGLQVFTKTCAACHKLGDVGQAVGPDLAALSGKPLDYLLINILDPNRAVEARYVNYLATTRNGVTVTGMLASETGTSITLVGQDGKSQTLLRTDLEELVSTGKSAMPDGLEKDLKPQDLADLLAYLRTVIPAPQRKTFPGNQPAVVRPDEDGSLHLLASNCAIYGKTLVLESRYGNLGYWSSTDDQAVWTVELPRAGTYTVLVDYACADDAAGDTFVLESGAARVTSKVPGTGGWDHYRQLRPGEITLQAGSQQVVFRSVGPIRKALLDLRRIKLVPAASK